MEEGGEVGGRRQVEKELQGILGQLERMVFSIQERYLQICV